ncbi:hypothetical protein BV898_14048 [Hypsibius exemplaris]|uniref:Uncharacterized protein n=1 Tax=Hypsibius exemplaris TaxID=2072580 RepID=A0A1W0W8U5_HYPEX|nr:hypothetical protein BV898_14048 [Hypsibius exemplaris]
MDRCSIINRSNLLQSPQQDSVSDNHSIKTISVRNLWIVFMCLLAKFNWTSVALIYDISGRVPFNRIVAARIQGYL